MKKLLVVNRDAKEAQNADKVQVGKIGWLADYIEYDGVGYHGYYLEDGELIEKRDTFNELMTHNPNAMDAYYHEASPEEIADFQARRR